MTHCVSVRKSRVSRTHDERPQTRMVDTFVGLQRLPKTGNGERIVDINMNTM